MFTKRSDWFLPVTSLVSFIICAGNGVRLVASTVIAKHYNSPMRSDLAFTPNILGHITPFARGSDGPFPKKLLVSFIIFEILFYVAATTKNIFYVKIGVKLAQLSVTPKFYNITIPLNEVWPRLLPYILVSYLIFIN